MRRIREAENALVKKKRKNCFEREKERLGERRTD